MTQVYLTKIFWNYRCSFKQMMFCYFYASFETIDWNCSDIMNGSNQLKHFFAAYWNRNDDWRAIIKSLAMQIPFRLTNVAGLSGQHYIGTLIGFKSDWIQTISNQKCMQDGKMFYLHFSFIAKWILSVNLNNDNDNRGTRIPSEGCDGSFHVWNNQIHSQINLN